MIDDWRIHELHALTRRLDAALRSEPIFEYELAQAAQAMRLFAEEVDPARKRLIDDAERLRSALEHAREIVDAIDTDAIVEFVRLGQDAGQ